MVFDVGWGISLRSGCVVPVSSDHPARCPCCRRELRAGAGGYVHPAGSCSRARVERALAWRVGMSRFSADRPPLLQEHCVTCGDPAGSPESLPARGPGTGPAGGDALWTDGRRTLVLGEQQSAHPRRLHIRALAVLGSGATWAVVARRKCLPCATAQQRLDAATAADVASDRARRSSAAAARTAGVALDRAAVRWGLPRSWGPYALGADTCPSCAARIVRYSWSGAEPPSPRPLVVQASGAQSCVSCGEVLP